MAERYKNQNKQPEEVIELLYNTTQNDVEVMKIYESWAEQYDKDTVAIGYNSPEMLANEVASFYADNKDIKILDAAAGTGIVGKALYDRGFKNLDAIDGSSKMLNEAKKIGIYNKFYLDFLGSNKLGIADNTYDLIATTGSFSPGHVTEECFEELIRVTKRDGHIMILMSMIYHTIRREYAEKIDSRMLELEKMGQWKMVARKAKENYIKDTPGVLFILQKC